MKYAKVKNNKIVKTQTGLKPEGSEWVEVQVDWVRPTEYPSDFYSPTSNIPKLKVEGDEVHETWGFILKSLDSLKDEQYKALKPKRDAMLFGEVEADNISIVIESERDMQVVTNLGVIPVKFKRATGDRVLISIEDGVLLKQAYLVKVQAAFDWEESEEGKITALTSLDDLVIYLTPEEEE